MSTSLSKEEAFARLGSITRELHEALNVLGDNQLESIVQEIPGARDRLNHVAQMTEEAANKVLTLVEDAKPACDDLAKRGADLNHSLSQSAETQDFNLGLAKVRLQECERFALQTAEVSAQQSQVLSDIMMSQDFQDLSGQVIKKVIDIINRTELQLVGLLMDTAPNPVNVDEPGGGTLSVDDYKLQGPQTPDSALQQNDVDDLLASLGF
jgi:chemotaxis protein CheZ